MSKYILINVQGIHDVSTRVFDNIDTLEQYLEDFFEEDDEYSVDDLFPYGEVNMDYQTLKVLEIKL